MAKNRSKRKTLSDKFPLTLHPAGQYCKKIKGKLYYFDCDKQQAFQRYLKQGTYLHAGLTPSSPESGGNTSLKDICNLYLEHQHSRVQTGEIKVRQVYDQATLLQDLVMSGGGLTPPIVISSAVEKSDSRATSIISAVTEVAPVVIIPDSLGNAMHRSGPMTRHSSDMPSTGYRVLLILAEVCILVSDMKHLMNDEKITIRAFAISAGGNIR
jgi:hypothetical protein